MGAKEAKIDSNAYIDKTHAAPVMTGAEYDIAKRRIGNDLYEIFARISEELCLDNELCVNSDGLSEVVNNERDIRKTIS